MKTKRMKLEALQVRSFVTEIKKSQNFTVKGGIETIMPGCTVDNTTTTIDTNGANCAHNGGTGAYCHQK